MTTTVVNTIRSSGGDYTTLSAWEAGEQKNLVTADEISVAECYDDWGSGLSDELNISGWTVDATRYIKVTVASGHRHNGTPQSGFFLKKSTSGSTACLNQHSYTVLEWLDVEQTSTSADKYAIRNYGTISGVVVQNCIAKNNSSNQPAFADSNGQTYISCLAWGGNTGFANASGTKAYNCIAANCTTGFGGTGGNGVAYNCIAYSNTTNWATGWKSSDLGSNNATSTGSDDAPGASSVYSVASGNFVNAAANDYHLASGTNTLVGAGVNKYSVFTTDIDGDTWPSSGAWDIGFDYRVAGSTDTPSAASSSSFSITGSAANGLEAKLSAASSSSYTLTGSDASGLVAKVSSADSSSYTITGVAASGVKESAGDTPSAASSGSFTISGVAASGIRALKAAADSSSYTLTGSNANGLVSIGADASSGSYTITGIAAEGQWIHVSDASSDAFVITGVDATGVKSGAISLTQADLDAIAAAVWADATAIAAHAKLDTIIARLTC